MSSTHQHWIRLQGKGWLHTSCNVALIFSNHVHSWIATLWVTGRDKTGEYQGYLLTVAAHLILQSTMSNKPVSVLVWQFITCFLSNGALLVHMSLFRRKHGYFLFWSECIFPQWRLVSDSKNPKLQSITGIQPTIMFVYKVFKKDHANALES